MTGRSDEVEHGVDSVVPEAGVTLDTGLLGQDVVVLSLEVSDDFGKAIEIESAPKYRMILIGRGGAPSLVVDLVTETRGINNGERDAGSLLIKLELCITGQTSIGDLWTVMVNRTNGHGLDLDALLDVGGSGII